MARWVKSYNNMRIYKQAASPTSTSDDLKVGDIWVDTTTDADVKVCTGVSPDTFSTYVDSATAGAAGGSTTQVQYNNAGTLAGDSGFTTNGAGALAATGSFKLQADLAPLYFGAGDDATIQYDGTDLLVNPQAVGSGNFVQSAGNFETAGISFDLGTNVLDSYIEGEYTATITASGGGSITLDPTSDTLSYTRVGRKVTIQGRINVASVSTPTGNATINLPITSASTTENSDLVCGWIYIENALNNINEYCILLTASTATEVSILRTTSTIAATTATNFSGDEILFISFTYSV